MLLKTSQMKDFGILIMTLNIICCSFGIPEELLKEMREQVHAGPFHGQAKKILYWITL